MSSSTSCTDLPRRELPWSQLFDRGRRLVLAALLALAAVLVSSATATAQPENHCEQGTFCFWPAADFQGQVHVMTAQALGMEQCVPLRTNNVEVLSFANNTGHPVTVYQDPNCSEEADFSTFPSGSQSPHPGYVARAIKVWTH